MIFTLRCFARFLLPVACWFTVLSGCVQADTQASTVTVTRLAQWARPVDVRMNLYQIDALLLRSQQPKHKNLALLNELGIRTVISFRQWHTDEALLSDSSIAHVNIPIYSGNIRDTEVIAALNAIMHARQNGPVLIHCWHGADRTGLISAMYRIIYQGWSKEAAIQEMIHGDYGFHSIWSNIQHYIQNADIAGLTEQLEFKPRWK